MRGPHHGPLRLREFCPRWTVSREAVLDLLKNSSEHLSAKDIYAALHPRFPGIGLTTVYRTLELLDRAGLVHKLNMADGQSRYELKSGEGESHHHHLICTHCGKIINYRDFVREEIDLVRKTEEILARKHNFLIRDHNIEFLGLCEDCRPSGRRRRSAKTTPIN